ncbi:30S ribosomal protein S12 methylthiotransferase RimO [Acidiferrobacter sp.]|jgi:ribosomal protein S12 methylthiotransferase|uniref:30S ribosomal protein S12 methylthiotransferase RimO n=2 Tax=Acidiferrobacter sp. TaxID=1872107 RepID=UPI0026338449|nr:30S ribosomal protein S12 methylthiotransferase RimO [Acidiferrobacter sp.]
MPRPPSTPRVGFISLGCPKALVDSEQILTRLRSEGYHTAASYRDADLVIINTCGFIDAAVEESLDAIGEAMTDNGRVIVTGCLGAKAELIRAHYPEILAVTGPHDAPAVMAAVHAHLPRPHDPFVDLVPPQGIKLTPRHYAYLKISEGCNHSCRFCIIPSLRGRLVSRPLGDIVGEAERLVEAGVRELLIVSQDTSAYGTDQKHRVGFVGGRPVRMSFPGLVTELARLGVWVRLHYVYPYKSVDQVLALLDTDGVLPYLDVPFQHAHPRVLAAMRRPAGRAHPSACVKAWRKARPDLVLRSTFIVGFPGETEAEFETLLEFIEDAGIDRLGAFAYSPVEGAVANTLPNPVPEDIKQERLERLMTRQAALSAERLKARIGRTCRVLVDARTEDGLIGRSYAEAPEIDGVIHIAAAEARPGDFVDCRIVATDIHDLTGIVATTFER